MAEKETTKDKKRTKAPDSTNILELYSEYVEMMKDISTTIVTSGLAKPKAFKTLQKFNDDMSVFVEDVMGVLGKIDKYISKDASDSISTVVKSISSLIAIPRAAAAYANPVVFLGAYLGLKAFCFLLGDISKLFTLVAGNGKMIYKDPKTGDEMTIDLSQKATATAINNTQEIIKVIASLTNVIKEVAKTNAKARIASLALSAMEKFMSSVVKMFISIENDIKEKDIVGATKAVSRMSIVLLQMKKVMTSCILMGILGIVAIPGLIITWMFTKLLVLMFVGLALSRRLSKEALKSLFMMGKVALLMTAVALSFMLLGAFILKYWKLALVGLGAFMLTVLGIALFMIVIGGAKPLIDKGGKQLLWIALTLVVFSMGMVLVGYMTKLLEWKDFLMMTIITAISVGAFILISKFGADIKSGGVGMLLMSVSLIVLAGALWGANRLLEKLSLEDYLKLSAVVAAVVGVYYLIGQPAVSAFLILGGAAMALVGTSLLLFALGLTAINAVAKKLALKDFENLREIVKPVCGIYKELFKHTVSITVGAPLMILVGTSLLLFSTGLAVTAAVAKNVKVDAIGNLVEGIKALIDRLGEITFDSKSLYKAWNSLSIVRQLTKNLSGIAEDIGNIAKLQIPYQWDKEGNAIAYRQLTTEDFTNAATNVGAIITALMTEDMIKTVQSVSENFTKRKAEIFGTVLDAMGNVSSIADVVIRMASMQIPDSWDKEGKALTYRTLTDDELTTAKDNVVSILISILDAITRPSTVEQINNLKKKTAENLNNVLSSMGSVASVADVVIRMASMQIPDSWDKEGKALTYRTLTETELDNARDNVVDIMTTLINAMTNEKITNAIKKIDKDSVETMGALFDSIGKIGSIVDVVIKLSSGSYPIDFDAKTGKATKYGDFSSLMEEANLNAMVLNLTNILKSAIEPFALIPPYPEDNINDTIALIIRTTGIYRQIAELESTKYVGNIEKATNATGKFLEQVNAVDGGKLGAMERISSNLLGFSQSINGNFDKLADLISEKLVDVLVELNDTLDGVGEKLEDTNSTIENSNNIKQEQTTTVAAQTSPNPKDKETSKPNEKNPNDKKIIELLTKINNKLKGNIGVTITNTEPIEVSNK